MASISLLLRSSRAFPAGSTLRPIYAAYTGRPLSFSTDTHEDFQPQTKGDASKSVAEQIKEDVTKHVVFIYMKGQPERPMCGFSNMACRILDLHSVPYGSRDVLSDPDLREGIKQFTHWPTIPQIFVKGEFIGGSDILYQMHQSGELETQLKEAAGVSPAS
ncbi:GRX5 [Auxenochlorella protothecoides x Auxenochlorella symbiontica]|uniref:Glutaredoxin domain-containing protein n=2 Tax=Auxenochlorella protothecoides TaxID=3075 RepID=A0A1D2A5C9_AUXPR